MHRVGVRAERTACQRRNVRAPVGHTASPPPLGPPTARHILRRVKEGGPLPEVERIRQWLLAPRVPNHGASQVVKVSMSQQGAHHHRVGPEVWRSQCSVASAPSSHSRRNTRCRAHRNGLAAAPGERYSRYQHGLSASALLAAVQLILSTRLSRLLRAG